jgi:DNA-binding MurR/RpiR family transcriptional regulator
MLLLERIERELLSLPPSLRKLGELIVRDYQSVAFMTVSAVSERTGVSTASVMRFARTLGFDGFSELQKEIRRITRQDLRGPDRLSLGEEFYARKGARLSTHIEKALENIQTLQKLHDEGEFLKAASMICAAPQVVVAGARSTSYLAEHLCFGLTKSGLNCHATTEVSEADFQLVDGLPEGSCMVVIGFSRYVRGLIEIKEFAAARGIRIIAITDSRYAPLAGDVTLETPVESVSFMAFHSAPLIVLSALLDEVSGLNRERALAALEKFEKLAKARNLFATTSSHRGKASDPSASDAVT